MQLKPAPLFGIGNVGKSPNVDAQERVNLYVEISPDPEGGSRITLHGTPGTSSFTNLGANPARGMYSPSGSDVMYVVAGQWLYEIAADGTATSRGTLATSSDRVDMVDNGDQMLIVDGSYGYIYTFATNGFVAISDPNYVAGDTCTFLNGYFIVQRSASGEFAISALYDGTSWDALDYATAESDPDNLVRVIADHGVLWLFGERTAEPWADSGAADFPFARIGSSAIEWGLAARWSLCKFMDGLAFLRRNKIGAVQACLLTGSAAVPISNPEMDYLFSTYAVDNATAVAYMVSGHPMYQINFPTEDVSWCYDGLSGAWHRAQYSTAGRHHAEIQVGFLGRTYVSDYANGKVYLLDSEEFTDDGAVIVRELTARHIKNGNWIHFAQLWIDMETGVGLQTGQGSDPQVMLQISRDGGRTWGNELWRSFGAAGKYLTRAVWNRLGRARDWVFRVRVTDPVKVVLVAAWGRYGS